jgi:hypothetical protein
MLAFILLIYYSILNSIKLSPFFENGYLIFDRVNIKLALSYKSVGMIHISSKVPLFLSLIFLKKEGVRPVIFLN